MPICKHCKEGVSRHSTIVDASGVFCAFYCGSEKCEQEIKKGYNPRIFTSQYNPDKSDVEFYDDSEDY